MQLTCGVNKQEENAFVVEPLAAKLLNIVDTKQS